MNAYVLWRNFVDNVARTYRLLTAFYVVLLGISPFCMFTRNSNSGYYYKKVLFILIVIGQFSEHRHE